MTASPQDLVNDLVAADELPTKWRDAFASIPRELFIPDDVWRITEGGTRLVPIHRAADLVAWRDLVYSREAIATQVDGTEDVTSSSSMPEVMALMLDRLDPRPGGRILEIGTGTGWNAALLAHRFGDENVISVEVDPLVSDRARTALERAGRNPSVVTADGSDGYPPGAPYDRVIATCAFYQMPYPWVAQARPGGRIVAPWSNASYGGLAVLDVSGDGTASGHFRGDTAFMPLRSQARAWHRVADLVHDDDPAEETTTPLFPGPMFNSPDGEFALGALMPDCDVRTFSDDDDPNHAELYLLEPDTRSWAHLDYHPEDDRWPVRQHGPRRLWDEFEGAHSWWDEHGHPERTRFGMTVTPDRQWTWLDSPDQPVRAEG